MNTFQMRALSQHQSSQLTFVDEVKTGSVSSAGNKRSVDKITKAKEVSNHSPQPPLQGRPPTGDVSLCLDSSILMTRPPSTRSYHVMNYDCGDFSVLSLFGYQ